MYVEKDKIPAHLRFGHTKFQVEGRERYTIPSDAGVWSGGTRNTYSIVRLADGSAITPPGVDHGAAPWDKRQDIEVTLEPEFAVLKHSMFCGKDMGLTFYVHPSNITQYLPPAITLTDDEKIVLEIHKTRISSARKDCYWRCKLSAAQVDAARQGLVAKDLMKKNGAVTILGRNTAAENKTGLIY